MNFDKQFNKPIFKEKGFFFETSPRKVYIVFIRALTPLSAAGEGEEVKPGSVGESEEIQPEYGRKTFKFRTR